MIWYKIIWHGRPYFRGVQRYVVLLSSNKTFFLIWSSRNSSSTSAKKKTPPADVSCTVTRFCHLTAAVTFRRVHHPPSPFSIALSHRCFSKLMAFFCRATFSTARFRLHRKFVRRLARSVSRGTSASGNFEKCIAFEKKCQDQQKQQ